MVRKLLQFNYGNTVIIFDKYKKTFVTCWDSGYVCVF